jgi:NAD(P)-dependent dehydrogenase (short-subunit alcohol dehydrogenase family)
MKILVTGGNNGLGLDLCSSLLKDGHEVFAISKNINN